MSNYIQKNDFSKLHFKYYRPYVLFFKFYCSAS